jgi:hypothetical protein
LRCLALLHTRNMLQRLKHPVLAILAPLRKDTRIKVARMAVVVIHITSMDMCTSPRLWYQRALFLRPCKFPFFTHICQHSIEVISIHSRHDVCSTKAWAFSDTRLLGTMKPIISFRVEDADETMAQDVAGSQLLELSSLRWCFVSFNSSRICPSTRLLGPILNHIPAPLMQQGSTQPNSMSPLGTVSGRKSA